jgi:CO dehydrogenase maturation factor
LIQTISYSNKLIELELKGKAAFSNNEKLLSEVCEIVAKLEEYVK